MPDLKSLTTKEVALLCRVSDATVKRWEAAGILRSERTSGGHRRFRVEEVARFQREQGLGLKHFLEDSFVTQAPASHRRGSKDLLSPSLFQALISGREEDVSAILINTFLRAEPLPKIFDGIVTDALRRIGELWVSGELTIAQEHLASRTLLNALQKLRAVVPAPEITRNLAICWAVESDHHELPTHLAQITLESAGWEVLNFGANMPLYSLTKEIARRAPELICISATLIHDLERLARDYKDFRAEITKLNIAIVIGGRSLADERIRKRFPADLHAESFQQLMSFANEISARQLKIED